MKKCKVCGRDMLEGENRCLSDGYDRLANRITRKELLPKKRKGSSRS
jgi:ribosomal protein L28